MTRSSLVDITPADDDGPPAMTCGICGKDWEMGHDCPLGASEQSGLLVPPYIAEELFASNRRADRERKQRRRAAWVNLVLWCSVLLLSVGELLPVDDWRALLRLLLYGVSVVGCHVNFLRLWGRLPTRGHVPSAKHVARWGNWQGRSGKGVE